MRKNILLQLQTTKQDDVDEMRKLVKKYVNIERPGLTNGTDSFVEWYEDLEEETTKQEEDNES